MHAKINITLVPSIDTFKYYLGVLKYKIFNITHTHENETGKVNFLTCTTTCRSTRLYCIFQATEIGYLKQQSGITK